MHTGKVLQLNAPNNDYQRVSLVIAAGTFKTVFVHRLVASSFSANSDTSLQVNHQDGNRQNNTLANLEWVLCKQNLNHGHSRRAKEKSLALKQFLRDRPDFYKAALEIRLLLLTGTQDLTIWFKTSDGKTVIRVE